MTTIRNVAHIAGVSTATVSHVVNGTRSVSDSARERVLSAITQLHYQPNVVARSLRRQQTLTLGLLVPTVENPFFARVVSGIETAANRSGYSTILCNSNWSLPRELAYLQDLLARRVDGLVFISLNFTAEHILPLLKRGTPVVVFERSMAGLELDSVGIDNRKGAYDATSHLIDLGHQRIGCITGICGSQLNDERLAGYRDALCSADMELVPELIRVGDYTAESGMHHAQALLGLPDPPTAIFAFNDLMAMGVMQVTTQRGLRIPDDLAVVGFDGVALTRHTCPPLSTVAQPVGEMSTIAIELLLERVNGVAPPESRVVIVEPKLVVRASTVGYASADCEVDGAPECLW